MSPSYRNSSVAQVPELDTVDGLGEDVANPCRVLAEDVVAAVNVPPFDNSAVDGYAVRGEDLDAERENSLAIVDRVLVLRDGEAIDCRPIGEVTRDELIRLMVGRRLEEEFPKRQMRIGPLSPCQLSL